jgi:hypothetical protein
VCANPVDDIKDYNQGFTYDNGAFQNFFSIVGMIAKLGWSPLYITSPKCDPGIGQKNRLNLLTAGRVAIKDRRG